MKAILFHEYGSPGVFKLEEVEKPTPKHHEVSIKVYAATVTPADCEIRSFKVPLWYWLPLRLYIGILKPRIKILGQEFAGEIESVGKEVKLFKKGDQVFGTTGIGFGAYKEYRCQPSTSAIVLKPAKMSYEEAACIPTGGVNALHFLRKSKIQRGEKVLINGASGCIGSFAVQIAKYYGAEVTGVDHTDKLDMLRTIGADHVIDYTQTDFTKNGQTYDVVFDVVGTNSYPRSSKSLTPNGRYLISNPRVSHMVWGLWTSLLNRSRLGSVHRKIIFEFAGDKPEDLVFLKELIEAGQLKSVVDRSYPLEQMVEAHRYVDSGKKIGNVAITVTKS